nr:immunoglobulin light chain junction region [Macaca mulatta]MOW09064.1 immunoglobulin light chain junction region [Macaca mulatta]MOW09294.1 immunoglobulin light chain junction region [Macaca mulatta]MOW09637.1 immunoglobulin light chain junction region [Macaca mulatta]MOW10252.1 immunoglobulin light chain junction region [Macaca mulatta]
CQKYSSSPFIF